MFEETLDESGHNKPERVGFGPRLGVMLIDAFFIMALIPLLTFLLKSIGLGDFLAQRGLESLNVELEVIETLEEQMGEYFDLYLSIIAIGATAGILYNLVEGFTGASPGKMIMGLKIANQDGTAADFNVFMMRWLLKNLSAVFFVINMQINNPIFESLGNIVGFVIFIGCFFVLGEKKLALHDMLAKTAVYKKADIIED